MKTTWKISVSNLIIAGIFIYIGAWFLLDNLGLLNTNLKNALILFIPYAFVVYGLWLLIRPFVRNRGLAADWLFGLFLFPYGALLLANHFGWTTFTWGDVWRLWPMIIIYVGSVILFHKKS